MKQTALFESHTRNGARMGDVQGWRLPVQFTDPSEECYGVRSAAGLFDVGCLGRIEVAGAGADRFLGSLFSRDVISISEYSFRYGLFCNDAGGIIDAGILARLPSGKNDRRYLVTSSTEATEKILAWLRHRAPQGISIDDRTGSLAQVALQGPRSDDILQAVAGSTFKRLKHKRLKEMTITGTAVLVSRSGLTGERGYELFVPADQAAALWDILLRSGRGFGLVPCGSTCRDMLRIEAGIAQQGSELTETRTPFEAGLMSVVDLSHDFVGRAALLRLRDETPRMTLVGFELFDKGIPNAGGIIYSESREIGTATSGNHSPHRRRDVGLGYVDRRYAQAGQEIDVEVKDSEISARIIPLPFYRRK
jgi:aminomethyltransferase